MSPQLARLAEIVRRNARNHRRLEILVKVKEMGMGPHVCAVQGDKDGDVSDDADALAVGILLDRQPLLKELPLAVFLAFDSIGHGSSPAGQRLGVPPGRPLLPFVPGAQTMSLLERHE